MPRWHARQLERAGIRMLQAGDDPQQRGLARARRAEQRDEAAVRHNKIDPVQDTGGTDALRQALNLDHADTSTAMLPLRCARPCRQSSPARAAIVSRATPASSIATEKAAGILYS